MVLSAIDRLRAMEHTRVYWEVPILGRVADLVLIQDEVLTTFEFKMSNWRRAIRQARDHKLVADQAYICMPTRRTISASFRAELARTGIGLAFFPSTTNATFDIVVEAPQSTDTWVAARTSVLRLLEELPEAIRR
jgi:hypothetical protein